MSTTILMPIVNYRPSFLSMHFEQFDDPVQRPRVIAAGPKDSGESFLLMWNIEQPAW